VDPRTGLDDVEKRKFLTLPGLELRPLDLLARSQSIYRLRYVYIQLSTFSQPPFASAFGEHLLKKSHSAAAVRDILAKKYWFSWSPYVRSMTLALLSDGYIFRLS
jgi:hypothetical protein